MNIYSQTPNPQSQISEFEKEIRKKNIQTRAFFLFFSIITFGPLKPHRPHQNTFIPNEYVEVFRDISLLRY